MDRTIEKASSAEAADAGSSLGEFRARLCGDLLLPDNGHYDQARRVWNGMIDKRPAMIVRCAAVSDVVEAIRFARANEIALSVHGGGHNIAGISVSDGGMMIDLSPMKGIKIDAERRTARAEPGLTLGEFDSATQVHGLATTLGINSDTGIAGLTLGGGIGRLGRKYGLACDNLIAAEVVLADGRVVTASAEENPRLFWGIRGGGGNFGIVTAFEYRLHPVGPIVFGGLLLHDIRSARQALRFYRDFAVNAPDEVSMDAVLLTTPDGQKMLAISACHVGLVPEGERMLRPLREFGPPAQDLVVPTPYVELQASADPLFARGRRYYWKAHFLKEVSDAALDVALECFLQAPSSSSVFVLQQVGGAIGRVGSGETAYFNREAEFDCFPISVWDDPAKDPENIAWSRQSWEAMRPFSTGGVYVNNLGEEGEDRIQAAYGGNYPRLVALKDEYDPTNLFRLNQNVRPTM